MNRLKFKILESVAAGFTALFLSAALAALMAVPAFAQNTDFVTIDPPGSVLTRAFGINPRGDIVGLYFTADNAVHGFLLSRAGKYTRIDIGSVRTNALAINPRGQIAGRYDTSDGVAHGYILTGKQLETIDYPGAAGFTVVTDITPSGDVAGRYFGSDGAFHGFTRIDGVFTSIDHLDANGESDMSPVGIQGMSINPDGVIAGYYQDKTKIFHAFLLDHGVYTTIDPPEAKNTGSSGGILHINPEGAVVGYYAGPDGALHGFIYRNGAFDAFDFPDPATANGKAPSTCNTGINAQGDIVGLYIDHTGQGHGFLAPRGSEGNR